MRRLDGTMESGLTSTRGPTNIVSGVDQTVLCEVIHRKQPEDVWCKQSVPDTNCTPLNLRGGDAAVGHMVAEDCGEGQTGEPLGQIGKRADITENTVGELGATLGCRGCLDSGVTSTEESRARLTERLLNASEPATHATVVAIPVAIAMAASWTSAPAVPPPIVMLPV